MRAPADEVLVEVDDLHTWFATPGGIVRAVDGVSLRLRRAATLGIVGETGSGKSALIASIMGLLRRRGVIHKGHSVYAGIDTLSAPPRVVRQLWGRRMSIIFQDPMTSLNPVMRVGPQLMEPIQLNLGLDRRSARERALRLLDEVGISEPAVRFREYPHQMSGGMQQRIAIAAALASGPEVLFADEPTTALDVTVQAQILDLIGQEQRTRGFAMALVTHDLGIAAARTHEIVVMYAGQIVEQAPTRTLFHNMKMPYTEALMNAIPRITAPSHARLAAIEGRPPDPMRLPHGCRFAPRCKYAQARCVHEPPPLVEAAEPAHTYRCWFPLPDQFSASSGRDNQAVAGGVA